MDKSAAPAGGASNRGQSQSNRHLRHRHKAAASFLADRTNLSDFDAATAAMRSPLQQCFQHQCLTAPGADQFRRNASHYAQLASLSILQIVLAHAFGSANIWNLLALRRDRANPSRLKPERRAAA